MRYYLGDQVDDGEVGGACGAYGGEDTWFWWGYMKE